MATEVISVGLDEHSGIHGEVLDWRSYRPSMLGYHLAGFKEPAA